MVIWFPLLFAIVMAAFLSLIVSRGAGGPRRYGPWDGFLSSFVILLLAAWAGGLWAQPMGPPLPGFYWIPVFFLTLLITLVLSSTSPAHTVPGQVAVSRASLPNAVGLRRDPPESGALTDSSGSFSPCSW